MTAHGASLRFGACACVCVCARVWGVVVVVGVGVGGRLGASDVDDA